MFHGTDGPLAVVRKCASKMGKRKKKFTSQILKPPFLLQNPVSFSGNSLVTAVVMCLSAKGRGWPWPAWLSCLELCPVNLIPRQGTYPGCRFNPQLGHLGEGNNVSLSLSLSLSFPQPPNHPPPSSLSKSNEKMSLGEDFLKNL